MVLKIIRYPNYILICEFSTFFKDLKVSAELTLSLISPRTSFNQ